MNDETDKKELNPTSAFEPVEEGYDPKKEKKAHEGWSIFFLIILILAAACILAIKLLS